MHWFAKLVLIVIGNAFALWLANRIVPGFVLSAEAWQLAAIALVLAVLNFILKPIFTLILGPVIILTLGLGVIIVNAVILYLLPILTNQLDFLRGSITIQSIPALIFATIIVGAVNFFIHLAT